LAFCCPALCSHGVARSGRCSHRVAMHAAGLAGAGCGLGRSVVAGFPAWSRCGAIPVHLVWSRYGGGT